MQEEGTVTTERPRSIRAIKAGCRVALLSQLDRATQAKVLTELERLVATRQDVSLAPSDWFGPNIDTLCLFSGDMLLGAVVLQTVALVDPMILTDEVAKAVSVDLLWSHLNGFLVGRGCREFFFGLPRGKLPEYASVLTKEGYAEQLGGDATDFYRKRLAPELGG